MVGSRGVYEALKTLFVTDQDGYVNIKNTSLTVTPASGSLWDVKDRAGRLVGIVYGSLDSLQQVATTKELKTRDTNIDVLMSTKARLQPWYQSNFTVVNLLSDLQGTAPHAATQRFTYTVPASRIAIVASCHATVIRDVAATSAGVASSWIGITGLNEIARARIVTLTLGDKDAQFYGWGALLTAGQVLTGNTGDGSTGGSCAYHLSANLMVFDT